MSVSLAVTELSPGKLIGASPSDHRYYTLVLFDISNPKKYRILVKLLKQYCVRIQKSVFEGQLKSGQIRELVYSINRLMATERYYDPNDNIRVYKIAGNCNLTVFGAYTSTIMEENIFF